MNQLPMSSSMPIEKENVTFIDSDSDSDSDMETMISTSISSEDVIFIDSDSDMETTFSTSISPVVTTVKKKTGRESFWKDEEKRMLMEGLKKHGKGQWERISAEYVKTRTTRQIYAHYRRNSKLYGSIQPINNTETRRKVMALAAKNSSSHFGNPTKTNSINPVTKLGSQVNFVPNPSFVPNPPALNQMNSLGEMSLLTGVTNAQFGGLVLDEGPALKIESKNVLGTSEQDLDNEQLQFIQDLIVEPKIEPLCFWESIDNQSTIGDGFTSGSQVLRELRNMGAYQNSDWSFDQEDIWGSWGFN